MQRGRRVCGLYRLGLNLTPITHRSVILKAKQEESKKKDWERNDGRKGRVGEGRREPWFGDFLLFTVCHKREDPSIGSDLPKD